MELHGRAVPPSHLPEFVPIAEMTMSTCRLCDGTTSEAFRSQILGKYEISYERCTDCGSLQTEMPYWLDEAYAGHNLSVADTGAAIRNIDCQAAVWAAARILGMPKRASAFDFGGGNGLLTRLLRDRGFDAKLADAHADNDFARGFEDDGSTYDIGCAFEVAEHLANPKTEIDKIFGRSRQLCILGTETYSNQGENWWYLSRETGQHIFFYSPAGMEKLGAAYGFKYLRIENWHLFLRRPFTARETFLLGRFLSNKFRPWVRAYLGYSLNYSRAMEDSLELRQKLREDFDRK